MTLGLYHHDLPSRDPVHSAEVFSLHLGRTCSFFPKGACAALTVPAIFRDGIETTRPQYNFQPGLRPSGTTPHVAAALSWGSWQIFRGPVCSPMKTPPIPSALLWGGGEVQSSPPLLEPQNVRAWRGLSEHQTQLLHAPREETETQISEVICSRLHGESQMEPGPESVLGARLS